ncbi:MAG: TonB-dependent receptor [Bacteroidales bacterium]|nr:TonB-dependent receptor [Bacteroidales bacterium]
MKRPLLTSFLLLCFFTVYSQNTQTIRGTVIDKFTKAPLIGATVYVSNTSPMIGSITDATGHYTLKKVPLGRAKVHCTYVGYDAYSSENFIVTSAKEIILNIELIEGIQIRGVQISAVRDINEPLNELAYVSARSFSVEETERVPVALNDVSKMAQSYPGTQQGRLDIENDIIVRGNTSFGMIWRLEGLDVPAPNHFARPGTSGGGISILSAQLMSRSDFYTGGMPAEFGNTISAAFDIRLKNGNTEKYENRFRLNLIGIDYAMEGPIKKDRSSFIFNARYSMLGVINRLGFHPAGENAFDEFYDFSFNLFFDNPEKNSRWNVFGMAGNSLEIYNPYYPAAERDFNTYWHWEYVTFASKMATVGAIYTKTHDSNTFSKFAVATTSSFIDRTNDTLNFQDVPYRYREDHTNENRLYATYVFSKRFSPMFRMKAGVIGNLIHYNFFQMLLPRRTSVDAWASRFWGTEAQGKGITETAQAYAQGIYNVSEKLTVSGGFHFLSLLENMTASIDPRLSAKYQINRNHRISLALGKYSQHLPLPAFSYVKIDSLPDGSVNESYPNKNLKMLYSNHAILSYQYSTDNLLKVQAEVYLQDLHNVPVSPDKESMYCFMNTNSEFPVFTVVSEGRGLNYGIDLAIEKMTAKSFYFLVTGSLFAAKYKPLDDQWYYNRYSSLFVSAFTAGKEIDFSQGRVLQFGARLILNGGYRYTTLDETLSAEKGYFVGEDGAYNQSRMPAYWRIDTRVAYRFSRPKWAMNISLDIQNVTNHRNANGVWYNGNLNEIAYHYHPGNALIPMINFAVDF